MHCLQGLLTEGLQAPAGIGFKHLVDMSVELMSCWLNLDPGVGVSDDKHHLLGLLLHLNHIHFLVTLHDLEEDCHDGQYLPHRLLVLLGQYCDDFLSLFHKLIRDYIDILDITNFKISKSQRSIFDIWG